MSLLRVYCYQNKVIIPTVAQAEEGFYFDTEPLTVVTDDEGLREVLSSVLEKENPRVPTPERFDEGASPILDYLGLKKWFKFEQDATMYHVYVKGDTIQYHSTGNPIGGTWRAEQNKEQQFNLSTEREQFLDSIIADIKADRAAKEEYKKPKWLMPHPNPDS